MTNNPIRKYMRARGKAAKETAWKAVCEAYDVAEGEWTPAFIFKKGKK